MGLFAVGWPMRGWLGGFAAFDYGKFPRTFRCCPRTKQVRTGKGSRTAASLSYIREMPVLSPDTDRLYVKSADARRMLGVGKALINDWQTPENSIAAASV